MRVVRVLCVFAVLFAAGVARADQPPADASQVACAASGAELPDLVSLDVERSGCCSWHGGVCGCAGVRAQCCDGTLSPSCGCRADTPLPDPASAVRDRELR
jgi:hypothetical protein